MARLQARSPSPPTLVVQRFSPHLAIAETLSVGFRLLLHRPQLHARLQLQLLPRPRSLPQLMVTSPSFFPLGLASASPTTLTTPYLFGQVCLVFRLGNKSEHFMPGIPGAYQHPPTASGLPNGKDYYVVSKGLYVGIFFDW